VREAGREAGRCGESVGMPDLLLHAFDLGEVLEGTDHPQLPSQKRRAHAHRHPGSVLADQARLEAETVAVRVAPALPTVSPNEGPPFEKGVPPDAPEVGRSRQQSVFRRAIDGGDVAGPVERQETARHALNDVLVEDLQLGEARLRAPDLSPRLPETPREVGRGSRPPCRKRKRSR